MTKTPEQLAEEYVDQFNFWGEHRHFVKRGFKDAFLAGYKAGFEIGCMKGSMAMQSTLDDDYHLTPIIDHEKLAKVMIKKETE